MRTLALTLTLLFAATALADGPTDGGVPADAAPPPADAAPPAEATPAAAAPPPTAAPPKPTAEAPYSLLSATPPPEPSVPAHARPTPLYRSALLWTSVIFGAGAVAAICVGAGLAASFHPRYALVTF